MKKLLALAICTCMCVCFLAGCSKGGDDPIENPDQPEKPVEVTLSLSTEDLVFEAAGGWKEFTIDCSGAWTLTGGNAWCQPGATSGSGRSQVKVMAEASTLTSDRNVNLTVRCGSQTKVLAVTQKGVNALTLSKDKFEVAAGGGDLTVTLQANVECTSTIPSAFSSWIKKSPGTKAMTSQSFRYTVSPNEDTQKREGYIVFTGGSKKDTVYVYQSAKIPMEESSLILSEDTYNLSADAQEITVELKTNIDYEVIVPDTVKTWVSHLSTRAIRTDKLHFSIAENEGDNTRSAVVIIKEQGGELTDTLHIRQAKQEPEDYLSLSQKRVEVAATGGNIGVSVSTNVEYDVVIPAGAKTWLNQINGESNEIRFDISTNEGEKAREAKIVVKARDRELSDTLHIIQSFKNMLTLTKKEYQVKAEGETFSVELQTNLEYDIFIPYDGRSWISRVATVNGLQFSVAANEDSDARESMIIIRSLKNALSDTLYVFQEQKDMIVLCEKRYLVSREKQEISVEIKSNVEYDVTISTQSQSWIEEVPLSKALTTNMLRYTIAYNGTSDARMGEIIVKSRNGSLADTVQVVQGGYGTYVGDIVLATTEDVNNFSKNQYTKIIGDIVIKDRVKSVSLNRLSEIDGSLIVEKHTLLTNFEFNSLTKITKDFLIKNGRILSLLGFGKLESIGGDFRIIALDDNGGYESLTFEGLKCLKSIDGCFEITHGDEVGCFDKLSSFSGLDNLEYIGGDFKVIGTAFDFQSLTSFKGLGNLRKIGGRFEVVGEFEKLSSFAGLEKLESVGGFRLEPVHDDDCKLLASFSGLDNLKNVGGDFEIIIKQGSLSALNSFSGLGSLKTIEGNFNVECVYGSYDALSSFVGLNNLESIRGDFRLKGNKFSSFVGLENLKNIGGSLNLYSLSVLSSFTGLENLKNIGGDFYLEDLLVLPSFTGLGNLRSIGGSFKLFGYLDGLSSFAGLKSLESIGKDFALEADSYCYLSRQPHPFLSLSSFAGLENLRSIGRDFYLCCSNIESDSSLPDPFPVLSSFSGLENLESIGRDFNLEFGRSYNAFPSLVSFNGLGNLKSIGGDFMLHPGGGDTAYNAFPVLTSLAGLGSLKSIEGDFDLWWLSSLLSLNGLENLDVIKGYIHIAKCKSLVDTSALKEEVRITAKWTTILLEKQD